MRKPRPTRFTVWTSTGMGTYLSRSAAMSAAHWVADGSGTSVIVANERTGERWDVEAAHAGTGP
jgi:hypothetical protein